MRRTNPDHRAGDAPSKIRVIGLVVGVLALVGVLLGYLAMRAEKGQPRAVAADSQTSVATIPIQGMSCGSCVAQVKKKLRSMGGVMEVEVSLEDRSARVRYLAEKVSPEHLVAAINDLGYRAGTPKTGTVR